MGNFIDFLYNVGKLKDMPRKGWVLIGMKNPASIMDHSYRMAIMAWILGKDKGLSMERTIKMALMHDLCELYAGDTTPYDHSALPKDKKDWPEAFNNWPRFSKSKKLQNFVKKHKKEQLALKKLTKDLPSEIAREVLDLWYDYEKGITKEARFVKQINRLETLMQAFEYGKETKKKPYDSWWVGSEEHIDDPSLIKCMSEIADKFYPKKSGKKK